MQLVPVMHDSQRMQMAPGPCSSTHSWLFLQPAQSSEDGTEHTGRPFTVIRHLPVGISGHGVAGTTVSSHVASSIVQPNASGGSGAHFLRRLRPFLRQWPEQHCEERRQRAPGRRQAADA
jgi:hypothetical protein